MNVLSETESKVIVAFCPTSTLGTSISDKLTEIRGLPLLTIEAILCPVLVPDVVVCAESGKPSAIVKPSTIPELGAKIVGELALKLKSALAKFAWALFTES